MDKVMLDFGFVTVTWYAFFIMSALLLGFIIVKNDKKFMKYFNDDEIYDFFFFLIIFSFLGARLWYVIFSLDSYINTPLQVFAVWNGGLAIHGGILAGLTYIVYFSKKKSINAFVLTDSIAPVLLLGQSIGRWGNFVNQEAHGPETTFDFLSNTLHLPNFIVEGMNIDGIYYHPTFLYESMWNIIGFLIIILILKRIFTKKPGYITSFYLIWYGFIRMFIEVLRTDALMFFNIKIAQFTSILMLIVGIGLMIYLSISNKENKKNK